MFRCGAMREAGRPGWQTAIALMALIGFGMFGVAFGDSLGEHPFKPSQIHAATIQAAGSRADGGRYGDFDGICACSQRPAFSCGCAASCVQALTVAAEIAPPTALGAPLLLGPASEGTTLNMVGLPFRPPRPLG
jgi:hypothetical protein